MKAMFDKFWTDMDIHRNNAFSVTAMEVAFNEGEEWLEQLLPYISANFDFVVDYCKQHIPKIRTYAPDATYLMWLDCRDLGLSNEALHDFMIRKAKLGLNDGCAFGRSPERVYAAQCCLSPQRSGTGHASAGSCRQQPVRLAVSR